MPIEYDLNSIRLWLDRPEHKELSIIITEDLRYLQNQSKGLREHNKEYLLMNTVKRMIKIFNEYPMMIDGRSNTSNNNNEPF